MRPDGIEQSRTYHATLLITDKRNNANTARVTICFAIFNNFFNQFTNLLDLAHIYFALFFAEEMLLRECLTQSLCSSKYLPGVVTYLLDPIHLYINQ